MRFAYRLYPSHGPLRFITSQSFRARLCHAKNEAHEEEAVLHPYNIIYKKHCQSFTQSQPFCLVTQQEGAVRYKTKRLHGPEDQFPMSSISRLLCRHERCLRTKELKKHCVTKQRAAAQDEHVNIIIQNHDTVIIVYY